MESIALGRSVCANHLSDNDGREAYCNIHLRGTVTLLSVCVVMPSRMREGSTFFGDPSFVSDCQHLCDPPFVSDCQHFANPLRSLT